MIIKLSARVRGLAPEYQVRMAEDGRVNELTIVRGGSEPIVIEIIAEVEASQVPVIGWAD